MAYPNMMTLLLIDAYKWAEAKRATQTKSVRRYSTETKFSSFVDFEDFFDPSLMSTIPYLADF